MEKFTAWITNYCDNSTRYITRNETSATPPMNAFITYYYSLLQHRHYNQTYTHLTNLSCVSESQGVQHKHNQFMNTSLMITYLLHVPWFVSECVFMLISICLSYPSFLHFMCNEESRYKNNNNNNNTCIIPFSFWCILL